MLTHSDILFKHKHLLLCYAFRFLFCIEFWIYKLTEMEEISKYRIQIMLF
jgi:hypothetical protein